MSARPGDVVSIAPYDVEHGHPAPEEGRYLASYGINGYGTLYKILEAHKIRSTNHPGRWRLRCVVIGPATKARADAHDALMLYWYSRDGKRMGGTLRAW